MAEIYLSLDWCGDVEVLNSSHHWPSVAYWNCKQLGAAPHATSHCVMDNILGRWEILCDIIGT